MDRQVKFDYPVQVVLALDAVPRTLAEAQELDAYDDQAVYDNRQIAKMRDRAERAEAERDALRDELENVAFLIEDENGGPLIPQFVYSEVFASIVRARAALSADPDADAEPEREQWSDLRVDVIPFTDTENVVWDEGKPRCVKHRGHVLVHAFAAGVSGDGHLCSRCMREALDADAEPAEPERIRDVDRDLVERTTTGPIREYGDVPDLEPSRAEGDEHDVLDAAEEAMARAEGDDGRSRAIQAACDVLATEYDGVLVGPVERAIDAALASGGVVSAEYLQEWVGAYWKVSETRDKAQARVRELERECRMLAQRLLAKDDTLTREERERLISLKLGLLEGEGR